MHGRQNKVGLCFVKPVDSNRSQITFWPDWLFGTTAEPAVQTMGFAAGKVRVGMFPIGTVDVVEFVILAAAVDADSQRASFGLWLLPVVEVVGHGLIIWDVLLH